MSAFEDVKKAFQDIIAPELHSLQVEIKRLDSKIDSGFLRLDDKIDSVDNKIDSVRNELLSKIETLDEKIDSGLSRLDDKIDSGLSRLDDKIDSIDDKIEIAMQIRERLASVEAKVGALVH